MGFRPLSVSSRGNRRLWNVARLPPSKGTDLRRTASFVASSVACRGRTRVARSPCKPRGGARETIGGGLWI